MERREIILGDLKVVRSNLGIDFYTKKGELKKYHDREDDEGHLWLNEKGTQNLKDWLNEEEKIEKKFKSIDYKDKSYIDKRVILRQLSLKDEISYFLDIVTDSVYDKIKEMDIPFPVRNIIGVGKLEFWNIIRKFLIDGFLSFEIISNNKNKQITLNLIDPTRMIMKMDELGTEYEYNGKMFNKDQIIYLIYNRHNSVTSYVEELKESYERLKIAENALIFKNVAGMINDNLSFKEVQWLNKCFYTTARMPDRIPEMVAFESDIERLEKRFDKFTDRILSEFKEEMIDKLIRLNK